MPSKEKATPENESVPEEFNFYVDRINSFLNRSDEPGRHITDEEKLESSKPENTELLNKLVAEKAGGSYGGVEYKPSKYRKGAFTFLSVVGMLIEDKNFQKITSDADRKRILSESSELMARIRDLRVKDEPITKEEVDRGIKIANEIKEILNKK